MDTSPTRRSSLAAFCGIARARRRWRRSLCACLTVIYVSTLSGCTSLPEYVHNRFKVGPDYHTPAAPTAAEWIDINDARVKSDPPADCAWWTVLNDPTLNGLVGSAYRQNLDLRAAGARIIEARAQRSIAVGNLFPQSQSADLTILESQISQNLPIPFPQQFDLVAAGLNGSWELDVWGRYRRAVESADARLGVSVEEYGEVLVLLLSDVAVNYIELRTFQQRLANAVRNVEIQRGSLKLAEARFKQGASSELDVRQARSNLWQTESLTPVFEAGIRQASNALCVLMGMAPTDLAKALEPAPIPSAPANIALGAPADLLARRPDVRRAEREVAAQSARIGIATAELYPSLRLNGYVGFWAEDFNELFNGDSFTGSFMPQFSWNVLNYGRISNNIVAQDARLQSTALVYQQTVLRAGQEVENAVTRFLQAQRQARFLERSVADAQRAVELVQIQFEAGSTDFNRVYNLQAFLTSQQDQLAQAQGNIALNMVAIYKALGGGWRCFLQCQGMPAPCAAPMQLNPAAPELLPAPPVVSPNPQSANNVAEQAMPKANAAEQLPQQNPVAGPQPFQPTAAQPARVTTHAPPQPRKPSAAAAAGAVPASYQVPVHAPG